jgi:tripartite-type tricarboxylate transporter receptor subunit TctC
MVDKRKRNTHDRRKFLKSITAGSTATLTALGGCLSGESGGNGSSGSSGNGSSGSSGNGSSGSSGSSSSGNFPNGEIQLIVPWAAGGGTDRTARKLASLAEQKSDASFYVSNITGGSGSVGFRRAANAKPDGHTIGVLTVEICTISHLGISNITPKAFAPVMQYNFDPASLTTRENAPYNTAKEFINHANKNSGSPIKFSNSGIGAIWHLSAAKFAQQTGIGNNVRHVPYDGGAPAAKAVAGGEADATTTSAAEVAPLAKEGPLQVLGIMGENRVSLFPKVPTLKQQGINVKMGAWRGLGLPAETPKPKVQALADLFKKVYDSKEFEQFMKNNGFGMVYRGSDQFDQFMASEYDRFGKLIKRLDIE